MKKNFTMTLNRIISIIINFFIERHVTAVYGPLIHKVIVRRMEEYKEDTKKKNDCYWNSKDDPLGQVHGKKKYDDLLKTYTAIIYYMYITQHDLPEEIRQYLISKLQISAGSYALATSDYNDFVIMVENLINNLGYMPNEPN